jgi:anhydro-N-acetylmuramic acid kinase
MQELYTALGLMSGTSADGIDAAIIETDGESVVRSKAAMTMPYSRDFSVRVLDAAASGVADAGLEQQITVIHNAVIQALCTKTGIPLSSIDVIGFHGHTIAHKPAEGFTRQIGDGAMLAGLTGRPVVFDFRSADVTAGGHGAPLVPVYHRALAAGIPKPLAVVNIGGVANITFIDEQNELLAFDMGPGNALINDAMMMAFGLPYDKDGAVALSGVVQENLLIAWLQHPFFNLKPPKSLDRNAFVNVLKTALPLKTPDAVATLTAFTAATIALGLKYLPVPPKQILLAGGGVHNAALRQMLGERSGLPVSSVADVGWTADHLEAEAFAFLAVRHMKGLPNSFPTTTGVPVPTIGGRLAPAVKAASA